MADKDWYMKTFATLLRRFTLEELDEIVFQKIDIGSLKNLSKKLVKDKVPVTKASVITKILYDVLESKSERWLKKELNNLRLLDISTHHQRLKWSAYELSGVGGQVHKKCSIIQEYIASKFIRERTVMEVHGIAHDGIYWMELIHRKRDKRGVTVKPPIFFSYFVGQPYIFITQNGKKEEFLSVISKSLGYKKYEDCSLSAKNIHHMLQLLKFKESGACNAEDVLQWKKEYKPAPPKEAKEGLDFILKDEMKEYINRLLPNEATVQQLTVVSASTNWSADYVPEMETKKFKEVECSFRSPNIVQMFKELGHMGLLSVPVPNYVKDLQKVAMDTVAL